MQEPVRGVADDFEMLSRAFELAAAAFEAAADVAADFRSSNGTEDFPGEPSDAYLRLLEEALELYGKTTDGATTLMTLARERLALNASDGSIASARSRIAKRARRIEARAKPLFERLRTMPLDSPRLRGEARRALRAWRLRAESSRSGAHRVAPPLKEFATSLESDVFEPLLALHTHLTSTCSIEVSTAEGHERSQSFGTSVAVLKSSDDPVLRRTTFEALNSWMASHASSFADLLNAVTGFRVKLVEADEDVRLAGDVYGAALRMQRTEREIFVAMTEALDERIEDVREAVRLRSRRLGVPAMRVAHLLCPLPDRRWGPGRGPEVMRADIARVFGRTDPGFAAFVEEAHEKGWINAQTLPMKAGGGWCDNMPAAGAVRIIANTFPNVAGEAQMTHLLGAGHLHRVLQRCSAGERLVPLSMIELAGNVYETLLVRGLEAEAAASGDEAEEPLLWLMLQRISNLLLAVSARHRLLARIYRERGDRVLSAAELNVLSDESWRHYFGDSTLETDRYVWVHKPHFYRQGTLFYDWQYVLGFLVSNLVARRLRELEDPEAGRRALEAMWLDAGSSTMRELLVRHAAVGRAAGLDPRSRAFWHEALDEALTPVARYRAFLEKREARVPSGP